MKFISLFAGIGGLDLGLERAGMECVAQVENNSFCLRVLEDHWPNVVRIKDVRDARKFNLPSAELICGGFPCQDVSVAGKMLGVEGKRSILWTEFHRIICEVSPRWVVIENVPGLLSVNKGEFFKGILRDLSRSGYDAGWRTISACTFGAPHTRKRVFIIAHPAGLRRERKLCQVISQEMDNLSLEALDYWNGSSHPFANIEERLASPGTCKLPDGVPSTLFIRPALTAYGNAVVPSMAEFIGRCIIKVR